MIARTHRDEGAVKDDDDHCAPTDARLVDIYRAMVRTRIIDDRLVKLQRQGRISFHVGCRGEEAAIVASAAALRDRDWIVPCYREVAALLWRGYPLQAYVDHMFGNADDPVHGRQMPDHTVSKVHRYLSVSAPIGTQMPHAVGLSLAAKRKGTDEVAAVYFGDGATSSNDFHAAMNFASVFKTPTVFLCRNNGWAISLPIEKQTSVKRFADKAKAYGMRARTVDGNDAEAVFKATAEAVSFAASGLGPTFIELVTNRLGGHSTSDDPSAYRDAEELAKHEANDPIPRLRARLIDRDLWQDVADQKLVDGFESELREAIQRAETKPRPSAEEMFNEVYRERPWHLQEQAELCARFPYRKKP
ncbi:MAG: thiamine pyrophosphate-dependent enzyme [Polyangiales bacterium]